jgi:1,4-alpha-glucan branching enzyme
LNALYVLLDEGIAPKLTLTLTPVLIEQLADSDVRANFETYLREKVEASGKDIPRFEAEGHAHFAYLASFYRDWYQGILDSFTEKYKRDLVAAFKDLQDRGVLDIVTSAATHGYLPLLDRDESIRLQLQTAVEGYQRHMGKKPNGIWLPECAYRPAYFSEDGRERPGVETLVGESGLKYFFSETHMIEGGRPVGIAAGEAIGPYGAVVRRYLVPISETRPAQPATTYRPYFVASPDVAAIGRDNRTGLQVWSAEWGYPGEFDYREFHKKDGRSGMQYWRVTGARVDLAEKDAYHPDWAAYKVSQHADHFAHLVTEQVRAYHQKHGAFGIVAAIYDTELFGHWWFEGVAWIREVLRRLSTSEEVELTTAGEFLKSHPPDTVIQLPEGSWGAGGNHFVWDNADTHWMWPIIRAAENRMLKTVEAHREARGTSAQVLNQAARELLLLQSSDWPFLVTTGQAKEYAIQRFTTHVDRFHALLESIDRGEPDAAMAAEFWEKDKVFPEIDFRWFR